MYLTSRHILLASRVSDLPCNLVPVIAPNIFDPRTCKEMGEKFIAANATTEMNYSLLIMGGDGSGYVYQKNEWTALIENFIIFCKKNNTKPLFITSRRTPKKIEELIREELRHINVSPCFILRRQEVNFIICCT